MEKPLSNSQLNKALCSYLVYFSNVNRAMQLSFSASNIKDTNKPLLFLKKFEDEFWNKELEEMEPLFDKEIEKLDKKDKVYIDSYKAGLKIGYILENLSWRTTSYLNEKINLKSLFYNQSLVMFVSSFESFMRDLFIVLINEDEKIKNKILTSKRKVSFY